MKKALIVASTAGFAKGFLLHDMQLLQQMGYEVHCAANAKTTVSFDATVFFPSHGILFHQIDFSLRSPLDKDTAKAVKQVRALIMGQCYDFIHCHTPIVGAIVRVVSLPQWIKKKCKIVYTTHGLAFPKGCSLKDKLVYGGTEWLCSYLCDGIITINREDYASVKRFGCKNVYYINGVGVDVHRFSSVKIDRSSYRNSIGVTDSDIMVLAVGELSARKNHQIIIKALSRLHDKRYILVICGKVMAGNGTYDQLVDLARELDVRVQFLGFRQDIPEITNCADIAVLPSIREGLGLAGIEALAAGVPVVGSAVQGIKDYVIPEKTGYLCEPQNEEQFGQKILALSDKAKREQMKPFCVKKAAEFSTEISHRQMEQIYREILIK